MKTKNKLSSDEKKFFVLLSRAITSNPFDPERDKVLIQMLGRRKKKTNHKLKLKLIDVFQELSIKIEGLDLRGLKRINDFPKENRQLLERAYLFNRDYHRNTKTLIFS